MRLASSGRLPGGPPALDQGVGEHRAGPDRTAECTAQHQPSVRERARRLGCRQVERHELDVRRPERGTGRQVVGGHRVARRASRRRPGGDQVRPERGQRHQEAAEDRSPRREAPGGGDHPARRGRCPPGRGLRRAGVALPPAAPTLPCLPPHFGYLLDPPCDLAYLIACRAPWAHLPEHGPIVMGCPRGASRVGVLMSSSEIRWLSTGRVGPAAGHHDADPLPLHRRGSVAGVPLRQGHPTQGERGRGVHRVVPDRAGHARASLPGRHERQLGDRGQPHVDGRTRRRLLRTGRPPRRLPRHRAARPGPDRPARHTPPPRAGAHRPARRAPPPGGHRCGRVDRRDRPASTAQPSPRAALRARPVGRGVAGRAPPPARRSPLRPPVAAPAGWCRPGSSPGPSCPPRPGSNRSPAGTRPRRPAGAASAPGGGRRRRPRCGRCWRRRPGPARSEGRLATVRPRPANRPSLADRPDRPRRRTVPCAARYVSGRDRRSATCPTQTSSRWSTPATQQARRPGRRRPASRLGNLAEWTALPGPRAARGPAPQGPAPSPRIRTT